MMYEECKKYLSGYVSLDFLEEVIPMGWNLEVVRISSFYKKEDGLSVVLYEKGSGEVFLSLTFKDGSYACLSLLGDSNELASSMESKAFKGGGGLIS